MANITTAHDHMVCVYCDQEVYFDDRFCYTCDEYKGIMTVEEWEAYTGQTW